MSPAMYRSIILFASLSILVTTSCSSELAAKPTPTAVPTPTPETLELINGVIDACLLLTPEEVEVVLGNKVTSEVIYPSGKTGCRYISVINDETVLQVYVTTDTTVEQDEYLESINIKTATEQYKSIKIGNLDFAQKMSELKVEDIDNLGDQAYLSAGSFITLHVLNNDIYYEYTTYVDDGIGPNGLMKLAQIASPRMPQ